MSPFLLSQKDITESLFPLAQIRHVADIRVGILTIREKWQRYLGRKTDTAEEQLQATATVNLLAANIIPSQQFADSCFGPDGSVSASVDWDQARIFQQPWHLFQYNDWAIRQDFILLTNKRKTASIPAGVVTIAPENIFIEEGAVLSHCTINAAEGPVYIGKGAVIMEGALIRGPFALCEKAVVKMGTRIYGATTVGPHCVVGGEIKNSILFGYSNKGHDGYLGDSVIGEWCNLGAGTSTSNVKNNAGEVKLWHRERQEMVTSGISKCGLIMGDYSKAAINTSFNTGTVVGVCANVFGEGLTPKFIPNFSWGSEGLSIYEFAKALEDIGAWKKMKGLVLEEEEKRRLKLIFDQI